MPKLVLILLDRPPLLNESQVKVLIDISVAAGQLSAASMVLPFVAPGLDKTKLPVIVLGVVFMIVFWAGSILLARRIKI